MLPIGDDNPRRTFPFINLLIILLNFGVFIMELNSGDSFIKQWAFIPRRFQSNPGYFLTIFTSMFMHAGWAHILGNMLYLWIFGDNIEDLLGHIQYLGFYLVCGTAATLAQFAFSLNSSLIILGASGAIAGVLGAYFILFAGAHVKIWVYFRVFRVEAWLAIGLWFIYQVFLFYITGQAASTGGVAYMAHIGGFITGILLALIYRGISRPANTL